jgi:hypothetical protein
MERCAGCEVKSQGVRLLDVFLIGPLMIWGGYALHDSGHKVAGPGLGLLGFTTILYNARNHELVRRRSAR